MLLRAYALPKIRSPLKGEAIECVKSAQVTASPSKGARLKVIQTQQNNNFNNSHLKPLQAAQNML